MLVDDLKALEMIQKYDEWKTTGKRESDKKRTPGWVEGLKMEDKDKK